MSRKKRILVIIHLCLAFAFSSWLLLQPWVKGVVARHAEITLYEMIAERKPQFDALPEERQARLVAGYEAARVRVKPPFWHEVGQLFFVDTPPFALAWLFFSIAVCIFLLLGVEGATLAVWILPFCVAGYAFFLAKSPPPVQKSLFPPEEYVLTTYPEEVGNRREQLMQGWHRYLITEWLHETPSENEGLRAEQLDHALFAFNVERVEWLIDGKGDAIITAGFTSPPSTLRLILYFIWNTVFAWAMRRRSRSVAQSLPSSSASL